MNRRTKRNLLYLASATMFALSAIVVLTSLIMPPPVLDLQQVRQIEDQPFSHNPSTQDLDFSSLLDKRLQGSPPPPPVVEQAPTIDAKIEPLPVAPLVLPDFALTNLYIGPNASIASFSKGEGIVESGTIGEKVFEAEILEFDLLGKRVKVEFMGQPHWLTLH